MHLLNRVDFNAIVDHLALMPIIKSKAEPTTTRIKSFGNFMFLFIYFILYTGKRHDT